MKWKVAPMYPMSMTVWQLHDNSGVIGIIHHILTSGRVLVWKRGHRVKRFKNIKVAARWVSSSPLEETAPEKKRAA